MRYLLIAVITLTAGAAVRFEENVGQAPAGTRFVSRGPGFEARIDESGAVWTGGHLRFVGGASAAVRAEGLTRGVANYLRGVDSARSLLGVKQYERVRHESVWAGVDVVFYGNRRDELEYDLIVAPGADPGRIRLDWRGPRREPFAYQTVAGKQVRVEADYRALPGGDVTFSMGRYDRSLPLVIDPVISFATYFGGTGGGTCESVTVDAQGYAYVTGVVNSTTFPVRNPMQEFFAGSNDVYVAKFSPSGDLVFSTYFGTDGDERPFDIAVDPQSNIYVAGFTNEPGYPTTDGAYQRKYAGGSVVNGGDAFFFKMSAAGDRIVYSSFFGGSKDEIVRSLAVDSTGHVYLMGETLSEDLPLMNPYQDFLKPTPEGIANLPARDVFVAKFSAGGSDLLYSTYVGSSALDEAWAIGVDSKGHAWVAASTRVIPGSSPAVHDWPLVNPVRTAFGGSTRDVALFKLSLDGSELLFSTVYGGNGDDVPRAITVDDEDSVYITGFSGNANYPRTTGTTRLGIAGNREVIISKFDKDGKVVFSSLFGGQMLDDGFGIGVDKEHNVYVAGYTQAKNFPLVNELQREIGSPCKDNVTNCTADWFLVKVNPTGTEVLFSSYFGGGSADQARAVAVDPEGHAWFVGYTQSVNQVLVNPVEGQDRYRGGGPAVPYIVRMKIDE